MKFLPFYLLIAITCPLLEAKDFACQKFTQPERKVAKPEACNDQGGYQLITRDMLERPELAALFGDKTEEQIVADDALKDKALESKFRMTSNMNGAKFKFPSGITRNVFRGSYQAPSFGENSVLVQQSGEVDQKVACMNSLVQDYKLAKIVNYDELDWQAAQKLTNDEKILFSSLNPDGAYWEFTKSYGRTFQYKFKKAQGASLAEQKRDVMDMVYWIINAIEGDPQKPGSVYIHCYGGHHRTGVVYGVMQKCLGKMNVEDVINEYKCHIGYESAEKPGGFHADNETLIREFPCDEYFKVGAK